MSPHLNVSPRPIVQTAVWSYSNKRVVTKEVCLVRKGGGAGIVPHTRVFEAVKYRL